VGFRGEVNRILGNTLPVLDSLENEGKVEFGKHWHQRSGRRLGRLGHVGLDVAHHNLVLFQSPGVHDGELRKW
jgi:hypothetical protein